MNVFTFLQYSSNDSLNRNAQVMRANIIKAFAKEMLKSLILLGLRRALCGFSEVYKARRII